MLKDKVNTTKLTQLKELQNITALAIDKGCGARDLASLCKLYKEILNEIECLEGPALEENVLAQIRREMIEE